MFEGVVMSFIENEKYFVLSFNIIFIISKGERIIMFLRTEEVIIFSLLKLF